MADALHAVMEADRTVYTRNVVNRLQNDEKVITASEHWQDDKALPLPAQMFRMGSEMAAQKNSDFSYALLSLWPVNKQNVPKTDVEKSGLQFVVDNKGKKVDLTMAFVGTRAVFEQAGFTKAADTDAIAGGFPRVLMRRSLA